MITTAAKWFFGLGLVSFVLAVVYGYSTGGGRLGPLTAGYYGGVGDHLGYLLLLTIAVGADLLGIIAVVTRDANPHALARGAPAGRSARCRTGTARVHRLGLRSAAPGV